jgi:adenylate cyclase
MLPDPKPGIDPTHDFAPVDMAPLRLFLEELVCNLCRERHVAEGIRPEQVLIRQEVRVAEDAFADILVSPEGRAPYFVEVDHGYGPMRLKRSLARKYGRRPPVATEAHKVILVVDLRRHEDPESLIASLEDVIDDSLSLEVWDEDRLGEMLETTFGFGLDLLTPTTIQAAREAVDRSKGRKALGEQYADDALDAALLWHLGYWQMAEYARNGRWPKNAILSPGTYDDVIVLIADITGFTRFVRETPSSRVVRDSLASFYSKARYQIIHSGGMLLQFVGDSVVALFGVPRARPGYVEAALDCAEMLLSIGDSVVTEWQRQIDHIQPASGAHVGIALGDVQLLSLRPFGRSRLSAIGGSINLASRMMEHAGNGEILVSNSVQTMMTTTYRRRLLDLEPLEISDMGLIRAWRYEPPARQRVALPPRR